MGITLGLALFAPGFFTGPFRISVMSNPSLRGPAMTLSIIICPGSSAGQPHAICHMENMPLLGLPPMFRLVMQNHRSDRPGGIISQTNRLVAVRFGFEVVAFSRPDQPASRTESTGRSPVRNWCRSFLGWPLQNSGLRERREENQGGAWRVWAFLAYWKFAW